MDSANGFCGVNICLCSIVSCLMLFRLFSFCRLPLGAVFASRTAAPRTAAGPNTWLPWEGKYFSRSRVFVASRIERRQADYSESVLRGSAGKPARAMLLCFESLAFFRVGAYSTLLRPTRQSLCELWLLAGVGLGA